MSSGRFYQPIYLYGNSIINGGFQPLGLAPSAPTVGQFYFDTPSKGALFYDGANWTNIATNSALLNGQAGSYYLNRQNHTGQQLSSTISDFATAVTSYRLDQFAAPNKNIPLAGFTFTGMATTYGGTGYAAEQSWVLAQISSAISGGIKAVKDPVRALIPSNVSSLSGIPTTSVADGLTLAAGDRVILTGQTTGSQNGIWLVQTGAWTRPVDWNANTGIGYSGIEPGTEILVEEGSTYAGGVYRIVTTGTLTVDTTAITFVQVNKLNTYTAGNGLSLTGTVFAVTAIAGGGITVLPAGLQIDRTVVGVKYVQAFGDGSASSFTITHSLSTQDVDVTVRDTGTNELVYPSITVPTVNTITITFSGYVPTTNQFRVKVSG